MEQHQEHSNLRSLKNRIILTTTFLIAIIGYSFWEHLQHFLEGYFTREEAESKASSFFFICIELAFAGYTFLIKELLNNDKDRYIKQFSEFVFLTAFAAAIDRIFGDPYVVSTYDYIIFFLSLIITFRWKIQELTDWKINWTALKQRWTHLTKVWRKYFFICTQMVQQTKKDL